MVATMRSAFARLSSASLASVGALLFAADAVGRPDAQVGVDANYALEAFAAKKTYRDRGGQSLNDAPALFKYLAAQGVKDFRVRLWVGDEGTNKLRYAIATAKAAQDAGLKPYLVIFLSDDWADMVKQPAPKAWQSLAPADKLTAIENYAADVTRRFADAGVNIDLYEIGNEIDFGICGVFEEEWPKRVSVEYMRQHIWSEMTPMIRAAQAGVRSAKRDAKFMLHLAQWQEAAWCTAFFKTMLESGVTVDFAGLSYFPTSAEIESRRSFDFLRQQIDAIATTIDRPVILCETGVPTAPDFGGQFGAWNKPIPGYSLDEAGQARWLADYIAFARAHPHVAGAYYWSPEWTNNGIWDSFALFDAAGKARPAINAFKGVASEPTSQPTTKTTAIIDVAAPAITQGLNVYFGNLHAHTEYSDGTGTPEEAFAYARNVAKLDFLAVTEHNHLLGGENALPADRAKLYEGPSESALIPAATRATKDGSFVALYGQEFSSMSKGNHVNVLDVPKVIDVPNGDFAGLLQWLDANRDSTGQPGVMMFNHPGLTFPVQTISKNQYGRDDFGDDAGWLSNVGGATSLIEILNGEPGDKDAPGRSPQVMDVHYRMFLRLGFRLAPVGSQDNHKKQWGTITETRTGILARELTKPALLKAMRDRHTFASEDRNLRVIATLNNSLFGDVSPVGAANVALHVSDADEPSATYRVDVYRGTVQKDQARIVQTIELPREQAIGQFIGFAIDGPLEKDEYVFLRITQTSDNGADRAWTAPVWFD